MSASAAEAEHRTKTLRGWCEDKFREMEGRFAAVNATTKSTQEMVENVATTQKADQKRHQRLKVQTEDNHTEVMDALRTLLACPTFALVPLPSA